MAPKNNAEMKNAGIMCSITKCAANTHKGSRYRKAAKLPPVSAAGRGTNDVF